MTRARPALAALLASALALAGCGALRLPGERAGGAGGPAAAAATTGPAAPAGATGPAAAASAPGPGGAALRVRVQAPGELQALLERYLDLARLSRLARGETVSQTEWQRLVAAAPGQVRELLQTEGYFAPTVAVERTAEPDGAIVVRVEPGPRSTVSRVTLDVEGALSAEAAAGDARARALLETLRGAWPLKPGSGFRNAAWGDAKTATLARLRAAGYAQAQWIGTGAEVDPETHQVRLFLAADSGALFRFGRLDVEGLQAHDLQTVRNIANLDPGTPLTDGVLLDFQERLVKAGLFESVNVTLDLETPEPGAARVLVRLREQALQLYTVGVGVSANSGPRMSLEHVHRRPFGWAAIARNDLEVGRDRQAWDGELATHPREDLYRNLLGGSIERLETSTDAVLSQRLRLGRSQDTTRIERLMFVEAERSSRQTRPAGLERTALALSLNYHGVWRDLDSIVLPTDGFTVSLQGGVGRAHSSAASSGPFTRLYGRLTAYKPFGDAWYATARLEAGQVFVRSGIVVPDSQRFRAGGDDSVRGYGWRELGPSVDGVVGSGNVLLSSSVELARPISTRLPSVWGAVFVDAGNAADSFRTLDPVLGYGVGVRWRSPVGPLRVDWAYGDALRKGRLHFSVGIAF